MRWSDVARGAEAGSLPYLLYKRRSTKVSGKRGQEAIAAIASGGRWWTIVELVFGQTLRGLRSVMVAPKREVSE